ncbi:hypothetical protein V8C26DRAFT_233223 [Trichoderma gracile]
MHLVPWNLLLLAGCIKSNFAFTSRSSFFDTRGFCLRRRAYNEALTPDGTCRIASSRKREDCRHNMILRLRRCIMPRRRARCQMLYECPIRESLQDEVPLESVSLFARLPTNMIPCGAVLMATFRPHHYDSAPQRPLMYDKGRGKKCQKPRDPSNATLRQHTICLA